MKDIEKLTDEELISLASNYPPDSIPQEIDETTVPLTENLVLVFAEPLEVK